MEHLEDMVVFQLGEGFDVLPYGKYLTCPIPVVRFTGW
jgi:hypothetical protein